jgi:chromatin structure-remodeling complex protein RSC7
MQPTHARWEVVNDENDEEPAENSCRLPPLDPVYGRNFRIHDLHLESAPESWLGSPGTVHEGEGLASIPPAVLEELPPDCFDAFEEAKTREANWRGKWHTESVDGLRARLLPSIDWYPKSVVV